MNTITELGVGADFGPNRMDSTPNSELFQHGSGVAAMIGGPKLGICKECQVRFVVTNQHNAGDAHAKWARQSELLLAQLVSVLDEILDPADSRVGRAVLNMSFGFFKDKQPAGFYQAFCRLSPWRGRPRPLILHRERDKFLT